MKHAIARAALWVAAAGVGVGAVLYARLIGAAQGAYFGLYRGHPIALSAATPFFFLAATFLVKRFAPQARGSGIPQVLEAIELVHEPHGVESAWASELVSLKTAAVKVVSTLVGILGGASIGREGPTVQVAASGFAWVGGKLRRIYPRLDFQTLLTAGAAAGVAAAFNTPLAGVAFAIEEIAEGMFGPFRELTMLSVVIAGVGAQAVAGSSPYFGHAVLPAPGTMLIFAAVGLGLAGGAMGGLFALLLARPELLPLPKIWWQKALLCGVICSALGYWADGDTAGSGYEITRQSLEAAALVRPMLGFTLSKLLTTVLSYVSGMAGGIFSPCLSIGAGLGFSFAQLLGIANFKACGLIGMVAFFSGVVQAPLTATIIVMEMTDDHTLVLLFMVSAFVARAVGNRMMPVPLYRYLAEQAATG